MYYEKIVNEVIKLSEDNTSGIILSKSEIDMVIFEYIRFRRLDIEMFEKESNKGFLVKESDIKLAIQKQTFKKKY